MEKTGYIEIRIKGVKGNLELTPDNYDIMEVAGILEQAGNLLFPGDKKDRPIKRMIFPYLFQQSA